MKNVKVEKYNILITGAYGFIGSYLMGTLMDGKFGEFTKIIPFDIMHDSIEDIRDRYRLERAFVENSPDIVIHMAALANPRYSELYPEAYISTNVVGTLNVVDMCEKYNVKHLIFFSSSSVFGGKPITDQVPLEEGDYKAPISIYGMTKLDGERIVKRSSVPWTIVRPFTVYGLFGRKDMVIYKWINQLKSGKNATFYGGGKSIRGYTHVSDICAAIEQIIALEKVSKFQDFNIGGHEQITLDYLWELFVKYYPGGEAIQRDMIERQTGDTFYSVANISKAQKILHWSPKENFEKKVKEIIKHESR